MTPSGTDQMPLSLGTFLLLRDLIGSRLGVWFEEEKRDLLAGKLSDRVTALGFKSFLDYYYRLKYGNEGEDEWPALADALSVPETYFWREMPQIRAFVDHLMPRHAEAGLGPVQIWSAACASGEEPLTVAMALNEAGWFARTEIEIWASDFSRASLDRAANGIYRERSFRALPADLREKYFTPVEGGWRISPALHARVRYRQANLLDPEQTSFLETARYVFCRNVFIYFSAPTIRDVVDRFARRMPRPGYLFVGTSESLMRAGTTLELSQIGDAFVYLKQ